MKTNSSSARWRLSVNLHPEVDFVFSSYTNPIRYSHTYNGHPVCVGNSSSPVELGELVEAFESKSSI